MFRCECGSEQFYTHIDEEITVYYDGDGDEIDDGEIHNAGLTHNWPYRCVDCEKEYSQIPPLDTEGEWIEGQGRRYLDKHGSVCPICECDAIEGGPFQSDGNTVWQKVNCIECGAEWDDIYYLREVEIDNYPTDMVPKGILEPEKVNPNKEFKR